MSSINVTPSGQVIEDDHTQKKMITFMLKILEQ